MPETLVTELTFGPFNYGTATEINTGVKRKLLWISATAPANAFSAPVLTQTTAAGTNPLEWDSDFTGYISWDGVDTGDKQLMRWRRVNGGAWTTEAEQGLDDELLTGGFTWPLWEAAKPLFGGYVEVQEQRARYAAGVEIARSLWSNSVTDTNIAAPPVPTIWSIAAANKPTIITLSNANLTAASSAASNTLSPTGVLIQCPTNIGLASGVKGYFETSINNATAAGIAIAIIASSHDAVNNNPGSSENKGVTHSKDGTVNRNGSLQATWATWTTGDILCWAVDTVNYRLWVRKGAGNWNNSGAADPATNTGGLDISALNIAANRVLITPSFTNSGSQITLNAGQSAFSQTKPSGFSSWDSVAT